MSILLVDDEAELTEPLSRVLRQAGYQVDVANNGERALQYVSQRQHQGQSYDLLILDWLLPAQTGLEICQRLRAAGDTTPVLFLTAKDTLDDRVQGLDAGADDYLVKPFELRELLARVRALMRRSPLLDVETVPSPTTRLTVDDLTLDLDNQSAYRGGRVIALSEKECQLLAYLMRHPHQLLSHDDIYQQLWTGKEKSSSNVLAAQIRLLRRKIEVGATPLIHTIYGKGYWFGAEMQGNP